MGKFAELGIAGLCGVNISRTPKGNVGAFQVDRRGQDSASVPTVNGGIIAPVTTRKVLPGQDGLAKYYFD
jgi:hypothetical protein